MDKQAQYLDPKDWPTEPCWQVRHCPDEWREACPAWQYEAVHNCWEMSITYCQGKVQKNPKAKRELCCQCEVFQSILVKPEK